MGGFGKGLLHTTWISDSIKSGMEVHLQNRIRDGAGLSLRIVHNIIDWGLSDDNPICDATREIYNKISKLEASDASFLTRSLEDSLGVVWKKLQKSDAPPSRKNLLEILYGGQLNCAPSNDEHPQLDNKLYTPYIDKSSNPAQPPHDITSHGLGTSLGSFSHNAPLLKTALHSHTLHLLFSNPFAKNVKIDLVKEEDVMHKPGTGPNQK